MVSITISELLDARPHCCTCNARFRRKHNLYFHIATADRHSDLRKKHGNFYKRKALTLVRYFTANHGRKIQEEEKLLRQASLHVLRHDLVRALKKDGMKVVTPRGLTDMLAGIELGGKKAGEEGGK